MKSSDSKEKIDIAYLVLHYNTITDTEECIKSIINNSNTEKYVIVIVDNSSPNGSGIKLKQEYDNNANIIILLNEKNLGFARGNNVGFKYIKENYNSEFIAMINNDTKLLQKNFYDLVLKEYKYSKFAVLGPKILLKDGTINPIQKELITYSELKKRRFRFYLNYVFNLLYIILVYNFIKKMILKVTKHKVTTQYTNEGVNERIENVVLHGAFLIFSREYIEKFDGLDSRTYMYMEEKLLALRLKNNNLKSVYNPNIEIFHSEDSATNSIRKNTRSKNLFLYKNAIKSSGILLKELKNQDN